MSTKKNVFTLSKILDKIKSLTLDLDLIKQEISLLNSKTKWDLISEVTGGSVVYDSSKYSELYFEIQDPNNMVFCFNIPTISLNDTERNYMNGAYSGSVHYWVVLRATTTEAHLEWSTTDYNNVGSLALVSKIKVYGKRC